MYQKILVGFDGSENGKRALEKAIELAKSSGGELRVVVAADTISYAAYTTGEAYGTFRDEMVEYAKNLLSEATDKARKAGLTKVYGSVEEGHPAQMILAKASEQASDLVIVGRRGIRGLERFLMGSTSSSVISHSACDVLVVK